ncbi:MAG: amidohydrolase family protein [Acidobacteria bacterium]|nr:amidohydrolase family protein [Acidobacteriota bacterium]
MVSRRSLLGLLPAGLTLSRTAFAQQQSISIEEYEPKSSLVVPQTPRTRARFPFIDIHNHQPTFRGDDDLSKILKEMDALNMRVMVNLSGSYGDALKGVLKTYRTGPHKDRFAVFANFTFRDVDAPDYADRVAKQLEDDLKAGAQGLKIFKNFGMDLKDAKGQRVHVDDARYDKAFQVLAKYNALFRRHKNVNFISAHLSWLGGDLGRLGKLMDEMPNMYAEIGAVLAELGRQPRFARQWFIRYQDRVLMGKDTWAPEEYATYFRVLETSDEYFPYYRKRHAFWSMYGLDLPDEVLKKLYYKNALRLLKGIDPSGFPK